MESLFSGTLPRVTSLLLTVLVCLFPPPNPGWGDEDRVPEAKTPAEVKPGETKVLEIEHEGTKMPYFLRVPADYDPKRGTRVIVFMHGSNMNGLTYLRSFEGAGWCKSDILVCPNGETGGNLYGSNNFTFGSAPYVAKVTEAVLAVFKATRVYIGGHSQGGFVTYSVIMHYPDLYHGALPMAGDCWSQNEPNLWEEKPEVMAKQKKIAIAVIHGKSDPVVQFSQGQHAFDVFNVMGYPKVRLLAPQNLGHQFMLSPVPDALDWLDAMTGLNPEHSLKLADQWAKDGEWGWVAQTGHALAGKSKKSGPRKRGKALMRAAEGPARRAAKGMGQMMATLPAKEWLPKWFEFRRLFGGTKAAAKLVHAYEEQRASQRQLGERLFFKARSAYQGQDKTQGATILEELLEKAPASYHAYYAISWLEDD